MKLNKIGLPTHIEEKVVEIIKQQLPSIQVDSIGDKLSMDGIKLINQLEVLNAYGINRRR